MPTVLSLIASSTAAGSIKPSGPLQPVWALHSCIWQKLWPPSYESRRSLHPARKLSAVQISSSPSVALPTPIANFASAKLASALSNSNKSFCNIKPRENRLHLSTQANRPVYRYRREGNRKMAHAFVQTSLNSS